MIGRLFLLSFGCAASLAAQDRVSGIVLDSATRAPLEKARVHLEGGASALTDRFGRFTLAGSFPATLVVARIGARPVAIALPAAPGTLVEVVLAEAPVRISDLVVSGGIQIDPGLAEVGRWTVPRDGGGAPAVVARDVLRDLATTPAVTQSSVMSARPLIRGYDAGEVTLLLDGFDLPMPYHLARAFSSLPTEAVEQSSVITAPLDPAVGGTTGAAVDIVGRIGGGGPGERGGVALTPVSIDAWMGGGRSVRGFLAGRVLTLSSAAKLAGRRLPYSFRDAYGSLVLAPGGLPQVRVTGFISRDTAGEGGGEQWMRWGTTLVGIRSDAWRGQSARLELNAHYSAFDQTVDGLEIRGGSIDVRNDFARIGVGAEWSRTGSSGRLVVGVAPGWRHIVNQISSTSSGVATANADTRVAELGAYASFSHALGRGRLDWGLRSDRAGGSSALQPRFRGAWPLGREMTVEAGIGRSARLFHAVSDPRSMPEIVFYELWLEAGKGGIPVGKVDHGAVALTWRRGLASLRGALYASRGTGMIEIRPETEQFLGTTDYRIGRARTFGGELQVGISGNRGSVTATYALTRSDRDWGGGWIPWRQDRRHLLRLAGQTALGGWRISGSTELLSAGPLTPVDHIADATVPDGGIGLEPRGVYVFGAENSARGAATFRADLGLEREFAGPWGSRGALTLSLTNLSFGPLAPIAPRDAGEPYPDVTDGVKYERLFELPAIPSVGLRFEF